MLFQDFLGPAKHIGKQHFLSPALGSHHECGDEGGLEEVYTLQARVWQASSVDPQAGRLLWSHEGAAVHSHRNISRLIMASLSLSDQWLFPGLPPFWRVCHTSQAQGLITRLIAGQRPAPATAQRPCQLGVAMASCSVSAAFRLFQVQLFGAVYPGC